MQTQLVIIWQNCSVFHESSFAVVAEDKTMHRLVSSIDLNLDKASLGALAFLTLENPLEFFTLLLHFFLVPICARVCHSLQLKIFPLLQLLI